MKDKLDQVALLKHLYEYQEKEDKMARVNFLVEIMRCGWTMEEYCILQKNNEVDKDREYTAADYQLELQLNKQFSDAVALAQEIYSEYH
jgi:hypothetical protein